MNKRFRYITEDFNIQVKPLDDNKYKVVINHCWFAGNWGFSKKASDEDLLEVISELEAAAHKWVDEIEEQRKKYKNIPSSPKEKVRVEKWSDPRLVALGFK